jgi:iron complex outermembrane receptor protein
MFGTVPIRRGLVRAVASALAASCVLAPEHAAAQAPVVDLAKLSLENLLDIEVTSVSRRSQRLADAAASVFVLTSEDIRRSGADTLPDVLRLVPGLHVGQIDVSTVSVSVRGFGGRFANKLLVLVDGRSVYTPLFSGVFWNLAVIQLEDVERIEVARGPGATLWGANAVNGVINIITRSAASARGATVSVAAGTTDRLAGTVRFGAALGARATLRADVGTLVRESAVTLALPGSGDQWRASRAGTRVDWRPTDRDDVTMQVEYATSRADVTWTLPSMLPPYAAVTFDRNRYATNLVMGQWTRRAGAGTTAAQLYSERTDMREAVYGERRHTVGVDVQHARRLGAVHDVVFGAAYRTSSDEGDGTAVVALVPDACRMTLWSAFLQDDIALAGGRVRVTLGSKFEHNQHTGWEVQPNVRGWVSVADGHSVWAAVSRAVRLPARAESDGRIAFAVSPPSAVTPLPQLITLVHDDRARGAETLVAVEAGYRLQAARKVSVDVSLFRNRYAGLLTSAIGAPDVQFAPVPHAVVPIRFWNGARETTTGGEVAAEWRPAPAWRVLAAYSAFHTSAVPLAENPAGVPGDYPAHQAHGGVAVLLPRNVELDVRVRRVSALDVIGVPAYATADLRLAVPMGPLELAVVGRNLLDGRRTEYRSDVLLVATSDVARSALVRLRWRF